MYTKGPNLKKVRAAIHKAFGDYVAGKMQWEDWPNDMQILAILRAAKAEGK